MSWRLVIHHCAHDDPNNCHQHGINDWNGVAGGSFVTPDHEFPSHLELTLTVTDSGGKTGSDSVRLDPRTVELTFESAPVAGLALSVGAFAERTPFTREVIVGSANSATAVSPQAKDGIVYGFDSWTDGGAESRLIVAPGTDTTYRAVFLGAPQEQDGYLTLPGTAGTAVSAPAGPNFDAITGTLDIRADVALNNWSTSNAKLISNLRTSSLGSAEGYELILDGTTRRLRLAWVELGGHTPDAHLDGRHPGGRRPADPTPRHTRSRQRCRWPHGDLLHQERRGERVVQPLGMDRVGLGGHHRRDNHGPARSTASWCSAPGSTKPPGSGRGVITRRC